MRFLFCDTIYPGKFGRLPAQLAADPEHSVMFLSYHAHGDRENDHVIHARFRLDRTESGQEPDPFLACWSKAFRLGRQAFRTFCHIRDSGFVPDVVFITFFDGPALFLRHAFPGAFVVSYFGALRMRDGDHTERLAALSDIQNYQALQSNLCFVRGQAQKARFAVPVQSYMHVLPPVVDTVFFSPGHGELRALFPETEEGELVVFHMKGSARTVGEWAHTAIELLVRRPLCRVVLAFGNDAVCDAWQKRGAALPGKLCRRILFTGGLDRNAYRTILCASDMHVFPEAADPPLQEMLESMSCENLLMMPTDGRNSLFVPGETVLALPETEEASERARCIGEALDRKDDTLRIRKNGRNVMVRFCDETRLLSEHLQLVMQNYRTFLAGR